MLLSSVPRGNGYPSQSLWWWSGGSLLCTLLLPPADDTGLVIAFVLARTDSTGTGGIFVALGETGQDQMGVMHAFNDDSVF